MLGDRSLKLKHLNPNTLFVATGDGRTLSANLLDTVSGRFLHRQQHAARPPGSICTGSSVKVTNLNLSSCLVCLERAEMGIRPVSAHRPGPDVCHPKVEASTWQSSPSTTADVQRAMRRAPLCWCMPVWRVWG